MGFGHFFSHIYKQAKSSIVAASHNVTQNAEDALSHIARPVHKFISDTVRFAKSKNGKIALEIAAGVAGAEFLGAGAGLGGISKFSLPGLSTLFNFKKVAASSKSSILDNVLSFADNAKKSFSNINSKIVQPIVSLVKTYKSAHDKLKNDLHSGLNGYLKLPSLITNTLASTESTLARMQVISAKSNKSIATNVLAPAMHDAAQAPISTLIGNANSHITRSNETLVRVPTVKLNTFSNYNGVADEINKLVEEVQNSDSWYGILFKAAYNVISFIPMLTAYIAPHSRIFTQYANEAEQTQIFDAGTLQKLYGLNFIDRATAKKQLAQSGFNDSRQDLLLDLTDFIFDINTALEAWHRKLIDDSNLANLFNQQSYDTNQADIAKKVSFAMFNKNEAINLYHRRLIDQIELDNILATNRYSREDRAKIINSTENVTNAQLAVATHAKLIEYADLFNINVSYENVPTDIKEVFFANGQDKTTTQNDWVNHYQLPGAGFWTNAYFRGLITVDKVYSAFRSLNIPQNIHDLTIQSSHTLIRLTYIASLIKSNLITDSDGVDKLKAYGYNDTDAKLMLTYAKLRSKSSKSVTAKTNHEVSLSTARQLFTDRIITSQQYIDLLKSHGFSNNAATLTSKLESTKLSLEDRKNEITYIRDLVSLNQLSIEVATSNLYTLGLSDAEVTHNVKLMSHAKSRKVKIPAESELLKMFKKNIIDEATLASTLENSGYSKIWTQRIIALHK